MKDTPEPPSVPIIDKLSLLDWKLCHFDTNTQTGYFSASYTVGSFEYPNPNPEKAKKLK